MKGTLTCQCGLVVLEIGDASVRFRLQCGCCDCRQAVAWAQLQGGPKFPSKRPLDLWYFGNDIAVKSGKEKLKWYKIREDGASTRWVTQCCFTTMVVYHPFYADKIFMLFADVVKLGEDIPKDTPPVIRISMKDYPKSRLKELQPFPGGSPIDQEVKDMSSLDEYGKYGSKEGLMEEFQKGTVFKMHDVQEKIGKTTKEHIDEDGNVIVLGLKEYDELI